MSLKNKIKENVRHLFITGKAQFNLRISETIFPINLILTHENITIIIGTENKTTEILDYQNTILEVSKKNHIIFRLSILNSLSYIIQTQNYEERLTIYKLFNLFKKYQIRSETIISNNFQIQGKIYNSTSEIRFIAERLYFLEKAHFQLDVIISNKTWISSIIMDQNNFSISSENLPQFSTPWSSNLNCTITEDKFIKVDFDPTKKLYILANSDNLKKLFLQTFHQFFSSRRLFEPNQNIPNSPFFKSPKNIEKHLGSPKKIKKGIQKIRTLGYDQKPEYNRQLTPILIPEEKKLEIFQFEVNLLNPNFSLVHKNIKLLVSSQSIEVVSQTVSTIFKKERTLVSRHSQRNDIFRISIGNHCIYIQFINMNDSDRFAKKVGKLK
ncbi:hypothetical protein M0811_04273 [Anaeramoeba ignava]|uniref:Uncharacterized protein n=1 Tax=Anaeramoeba ignava TaxID=1746090 RepID=A0A9Q0LUP0_ANAIG|nr:hypothetical protein M0811_04273 [Anaeramoeba ignava]